MQNINYLYFIILLFYCINLTKDTFLSMYLTIFFFRNDSNFFQFFLYYRQYQFYLYSTNLILNKQYCSRDYFPNIK